VAEQDAPIEERKSTSFRWLILIVLLLLLVAGGGGAYWYFFMKDKAPATEGAENKTVEETAPEKAEVVTLPTFLVNLADPLGRRYVKMTLDVEVRNPEAAAELNANQAKVRDAVILLLSSKSYADLASLENKIILKQELVDRLNQALNGSKVIRVYFTELVVQ